MFTLEVLNPVAVSHGELKKYSLAPRPRTLDGKTVGLLWNSKRGGEVALAKAVKDYIWQQSTSSAWRMMNRWKALPGRVRHQWRWLLELSRPELENLMRPVLESPEDYSILVVGGSAGKDLVFRTAAQPSTVEITDRG
ncbi:MAG: hypothetical protein HYX92_00300 [Chloroflexi bacterium]|nr:hypothetical protein [Chloroflexota bacterium]